MYRGSLYVWPADSEICRYFDFSVSQHDEQSEKVKNLATWRSFYRLARLESRGVFDLQENTLAFPCLRFWCHNRKNVDVSQLPRVIILRGGAVGVMLRSHSLRQSLNQTLLEDLVGSRQLSLKKRARASRGTGACAHARDVPRHARYVASHLAATAACRVRPAGDPRSHIQIL